MKKVVGIVLIIVLILQFNVVTIAASKSDLQKEKNELQKQIDSTESEIKKLNSEKSEALKAVETLIHQISGYEAEIEELDKKIGELETKIQESEKNIESKQEEYNKEQAILDDILITMYEQGDTSYLDVLFNSENLMDFLSKYYVVSEITESNTQLLENIANQKKQIEQEKESLENQKKELNTTKSSKEAKYTQLKSAQETKEKQAAKLNEQEKQAKSQLEQYLKDEKNVEAELKKIAEEEARKAAEQASKNKTTSSASSSTSSTTTVITSTPSSSGYIFPIGGKTKKNITTGYMGYSNPAMGNHGGVDIAIGKGTPVLAVKDGTVVTSKAQLNANGSYGSYGEYIVIDHHDGTMTLYAHMLTGSRKVSVGENVKQGQVIGNVGTTGNSTGYHLHFEVRINGVRVNPTPYLP